MHQTHETDRAVRDGTLAAVTCEACGCRLSHSSAGAWYHFGRLGGRDARGCRVSCVEAPHDASGRAAAAA